MTRKKTSFYRRISPSFQSWRSFGRGKRKVSRMDSLESIDENRSVESVGSIPGEDDIVLHKSKNQQNQVSQKKKAKVCCSRCCKCCCCSCLCLGSILRRICTLRLTTLCLAFGQLFLLLLLLFLGVFLVLRDLSIQQANQDVEQNAKLISLTSTNSINKFLSHLDSLILAGTISTESLIPLSTNMHTILSPEFPVVFLSSATGDDYVMFEYENFLNATTYTTWNVTDPSQKTVTPQRNIMRKILVRKDTMTHIVEDLHTIESKVFEREWLATVNKFFIAENVHIDSKLVRRGFWVIYHAGIKDHDHHKRQDDHSMETHVGVFVDANLISNSVTSIFDSDSDSTLALVDVNNKILVFSTEDPSLLNVHVDDLENSHTKQLAQMAVERHSSLKEKKIHLTSLSTHSVALQRVSPNSEQLWAVTSQNRNSKMGNVLASPIVICFILLIMFVSFIVSFISSQHSFRPIQILTQRLDKLSRLNNSREKRWYRCCRRNPCWNFLCCPIYSCIFIDRSSYNRHYLKEIRNLQNAYDSLQSSIDCLKRFAPISVFEHVVQTRKPLSLGMSPVDSTVIFSDIEGFTTLTSRLSPEKLTILISEYFGEMIDILEKNGGSLDKLQGDGLMAFFNHFYKPCENHQVAACLTAVEMGERLTELNIEWSNRELPQLSIRIGIETGECQIGILGSAERFSYTAISNSVNLAARLESINAVFGTTRMIGQETYEHVASSFVCNWVDCVAVKGRTSGMNIYELKTSKDKASQTDLQIEKILTELKTLLHDRKFRELIDSIEKYSSEYHLPYYVQKLKKRSVDLCMIEARDVDVSLFLTEKS